MKTCVAVCLLVAGSATAANSPPPIDEAIVSALVKDGMSEAQVRASYNACDSGGPISMKVCFRYRLEHEDIRIRGLLDELRQSLLKHAANANAKELSQAQDAWDKYQYLHCSFEGNIGSFDSGTEMLACQWELARERANKLTEMLERWNAVDHS